MAHAPGRGAGRRGNCSCACTFARISGGGGGKPSTKALLLGLAALAAIIAAAVALDLPSAAAQGSATMQSEEQRHGKITARRVADDRIEFGWQPTDARGREIAPRVFPTRRFMPQDAPRDRWLSSSPVEVNGAEIGRINARMLAIARVEIAFTPTDGERILPPSRQFSANATRGRWLSSTTITIPTTPTAADAATGFTAVSVGNGHSCAIRESGAIQCWGSNTSGQSDAPAGRFTAVAAGAHHTCAIRESGTIECWGSNHDWTTEIYKGQATPPRRQLYGRRRRSGAQLRDPRERRDRVLGQQPLAEMERGSAGIRDSLHRAS